MRAAKCAQSGRRHVRPAAVSARVPHRFRQALPHAQPQPRREHGGEQQRRGVAHAAERCRRPRHVRALLQPPEQ
eukprot:910383-Alexandrium_andersonii.AAC.1